MGNKQPTMGKTIQQDGAGTNPLTAFLIEQMNAYLNSASFLNQTFTIGSGESSTINQINLNDAATTNGSYNIFICDATYQAGANQVIGLGAPSVVSIDSNPLVWDSGYINATFTFTMTVQFLQNPTINVSASAQCVTSWSDSGSLSLNAPAMVITCTISGVHSFETNTTTFNLNTLQVKDVNVTLTANGNPFDLGIFSFLNGHIDDALNIAYGKASSQVSAALKVQLQKISSIDLPLITSIIPTWDCEFKSFSNSVFFPYTIPYHTNNVVFMNYPSAGRYTTADAAASGCKKTQYFGCDPQTGAFCVPVPAAGANTFALDSTNPDLNQLYACAQRCVNYECGGNLNNSCYALSPGASGTYKDPTCGEQCPAYALSGNACVAQKGGPFYNDPNCGEAPNPKGGGACVIEQDGTGGAMCFSTWPINDPPSYVCPSQPYSCDTCDACGGWNTFLNTGACVNQDQTACVCTPGVCDFKYGAPMTGGYCSTLANMMPDARVSFYPGAKCGSVCPTQGATCANGQRCNPFPFDATNPWVANPVSQTSQYNFPGTGVAMTMDYAHCPPNQ